MLLTTGSPDTPNVPDVRRYLREFLMDPLVMDIPRPLRALLVYFLIVPFRARLSAAAYRRIWTSEGSPLVVNSRRLQARLRDRLGLPVELGMRYGNPTVRCALERLSEYGTSEIILVPLFPHYAMSSYETTLTHARNVIHSHAPSLKVNVVRPFYDHPGYIDALAASAEPYLNRDYDHFLFSFHGLPQRHIRKCDPTGRHCLRKTDCCEMESPAVQTCYRAQCFRTAKAFASRTALRHGSYSFSFQSRLGPGRWLVPDTFRTLVQLGRAGCKRLLVLCPSFVTDCVETLDEIAFRGRALYRKAGGGDLVLIPCLNDHPVWVDALARIVDQER